MRRSELSLDQYDTDKIPNEYLERYDPVLEPWVNKKITLLEIGVHKGGSLLLWRDYFPLGTIVGVDIKLPTDFGPSERIRLFEGNQADPHFLNQVSEEVAPEGFDIVIDDASHIGELTKIAFWHLFQNHLKPGGLYVIEDWGTGYWDDWPDGKSLDIKAYGERPWLGNLFWRRIADRLHYRRPLRGHDYGMVGFIKQLVDEQGAHDVTRKNCSGKSERRSMFDRMIITPSLVFVKKARS
jgi:hypothetical protein